MNTPPDFVFSFNHQKNRIIRLNETESTNDFAKQLQMQPFENEVIIIADYQTKGRGNAGNSWESESGKNLTFSIILKPHFLEPSLQFLLNKVIALGIYDFVSDKLNSSNVKIKWPNDIYVGNKKIAGTLIEHSIIGSQLEKSIVGIGININQTVFTSNAPNPISLSNITNAVYPLKDTLIQLMNFIFIRYQELKDKKIKQLDIDYLNQLYCLNEYKTYNYQGEKIKASIQGVNKFGQLQLLSENNNLISCSFKEIEFDL